MKNMKPSANKGPLPEARAALVLQDTEDPFIRYIEGIDIPNNVDSLRKAMKERLYGPIATPEQEDAIRKFYEKMIDENGMPTVCLGSGVDSGFDKEAAWIQTYSGRRFNPTNPNPDAIVIQDIAQALSMQCRFSGHCRKFYSVAQHSVLVSYICDSQDALWGLLHDASEAYLVDVPRPLKRSGKFNAYIEFEDKMQKAICKRFHLPEQEPHSVKQADTALLATEARDLMAPLHKDWEQPVEALPFLIDSWEPSKAKHEFLKRFFMLTGNNKGYQYYLEHMDQF